LAKLAFVGERGVELFLPALFSAPEATCAFGEDCFPDFDPVWDCLIWLGESLGNQNEPFFPID
jgi:hypothetical protein